VRLPFESPVDATTWQHLELDFGRIVAGFVTLDIDAPAGTIVDLHYREYPYRDAAAEVATAPGGGLRYVARGGDDRYESLEVTGLRYIHALVRTPDSSTPNASAPDASAPDEGTPEVSAPDASTPDASTPVRIASISVREYTYPWSGGADFSSNDAEIDALYRAGIRTVQLNSFDAFTDCPTREQRSWVGDGVVHQLVHVTTNADWRLAQRYVDLGDSPRSDGILPMSVAGEIEASGTYTLPDWSLHWVHGVWNAFRYIGDADATLAVLPTVERILRWYARFVDEHGTISDVPEWNLVDWSSVFSTGRSSILTGLWARALREFADMSEHLGNRASAAWARRAYDAAREGFEDFWNEERGTYVDHILDGTVRPAASQAAGATAIVSGLAPEHRWDRIAATIADPSTLVVRSWIGGADGGYDIVKMEEQARGIQRIDWDAETEVVRAEPFFSYVVHDAYALAQRQDLLVDAMRSWTEFLHDGYDTFGECWGWGTPVHGWSSTPTRDLVQYVLGVTPGEPGFASARVSPRLGGLERVRGVVPTPFGEITVAFDGRELRIDSPIPCIVDLPGSEEILLGAGAHSIAA
jgi:hypothetical protein